MAGYLLEQEGVVEEEGGGRAFVKSVCTDLDSAPITERERTLFRYLEKSNRAPWDCSQEDVDEVKAAGWSDHAIYDAVTVCAIFNFFNRWIDATGVVDVPGDFYENRLRTNGDVGYRI